MSHRLLDEAAVPQAPAAGAPRLRTAGYATAGCLAALVFGLALPVAPWSAVALLVLVPLSFGAPTAALSVLLAITVLVPFEVQDSLAVIGGRDQPGLLVVDVLFLLGVLRVVWLVVRGRLPLDRRLVGAGVVAAIVTIALAWGLLLGNDLSEAGHEARRVILGVGAFVLAVPLMEDRRARRRLMGALMAIGLALALWGLAQWFFSVGYTTSGDVGVRPGVDLTSAGHGQLQGGMYAFPVAMILAWSALISRQVRGTGVQCLLAVILLLNGVCLVLTFERTLWVTCVGACGYVALRSGRAARRLAVRWAAVGAVGLVFVAAMAPGQAKTAVERLFSVTQVSRDNSFYSRLVESEAVTHIIAQRPLTGSGFGATMTWGLRDVFGTITTPFVHNGYLWLSWKLGLPATLVVIGLLAVAALRRARDDDGTWHALQIGSQASVLALLLTSITFPAFNVLGITAVLGVLVAVCYSGPARE